MEALCSNLNCDFVYTTPLAQIDSQTYTAETDSLVITGTDIPETSDVVVSFGPVNCEITTITST